MFLYLTVFGFFGLLGAYVKSANQRLPKKTLLIFIVILVLVIENLLFLKFQDWIQDSVGRIYIVKSFSELVLVYLVHLRPCKESVIVMMLSLLSVVVNIIGFSASASGLHTETFTNVNLFLIFYFMLAALFSRNLSDGIYRNINRFSLVRGYCNNYLSLNSKGGKK